MAKKEEAIHKAQDRSAWMWARTSAATLIANHPSYKDMQPSIISDAVIKLATKIYNGEPTEPF